MRVRILQCLCGPARHAILAMAVPVGPDEMSDAVALEALKTAIAALLAGLGAELALPTGGRIDPWCGLCGAPVGGWRYELQWSREYPDWPTAELDLRACEADQRGTAALLDLLDVSYNARLQRETARAVDELEQ